MSATPHRRTSPLAILIAAWLLVALATTLLGSAPRSVRAADPADPATPTLTPSPTGPTLLDATVTFHGRGYGHGVGMSQHGARGRALAGQTAEEILAHYYQGATLGEIALDTPIRVRVLRSFRASSTRPLVLFGRGGDWTIDGIAKVFPKDAKVTVTPTISGGISTWRLRVKAADGTLLHSATTRSFRMRPATSASILQVWSRPSRYDEYRGTIRARLSSTTAVLNVINETLLETYLRGVVPAEMPSSWPAEALEAQAVAARSYAARRLRPGVSYYDVSDDWRSQVYRGREGEKASTDRAIEATAGTVLRSGTAIANTLFHSAGGGATENNENVYVSSTGRKVAGPVPYLRGSLDRAEDGSPYDSGSPYATWQTRPYTVAQLSSWFGSDPRTDVGTLAALDLRDRGVSGRLVSVTLIGSAGSRKVSGNVFRAVFNARRPSGDPMMRSTLVDIAPVP
ncbi:MAG: SpoIID/LytB domain-containing protein [Chloroflexota bacterium]|jgi:stage II sporulation protein D|nr:SpoIID/LytB domain-containing protein [Chloroflexota bacterium]MDH5244277.1 SpoIID/LytB domain-containing protein [Chloroflexota bacterium]